MAFVNGVLFLMFFAFVALSCAAIGTLLLRSVREFRAGLNEAPQMSIR